MPSPHDRLTSVGCILVVLAVHLALMIGLNHGMPHGENVDVIGPAQSPTGSLSSAAKAALRSG